MCLPQDTAAKCALVKVFQAASCGRKLQLWGSEVVQILYGISFGLQIFQILLGRILRQVAERLVVFLWQLPIEHVQNALLQRGEDQKITVNQKQAHLSPREIRAAAKR